jgi:hypothetical protein
MTFLLVEKCLEPIPDNAIFQLEKLKVEKSRSKPQANSSRRACYVIDHLGRSLPNGCVSVGDFERADLASRGQDDIAVRLNCDSCRGDIKYGNRTHGGTVH